MELITSVVPPGLKNRVRPRLPSDKSLGYYQISLREKAMKHLIHDKDVPKPKASPSLKRNSSSGTRFKIDTGRADHFQYLVSTYQITVGVTISVVREGRFPNCHEVGRT